MAGDRKTQSSSMRKAGAAVLAATLLAGCDALPALDAAGMAPGTEAAESSAARATTDIEAPEIFRVAERGLWDGRPSLGGVWVAHPEVRSPERVRIVNASTGREVIGALFRRERDLPGPSLQVSSDAAAALGMLAGAPTELVVTALRRAEAPDSTAAPEPAEVAAAAEPEVTVPAAATPTPADPRAVAAVTTATAAILASAAPAPSPGAIATTALGAPAGAIAPAAATSLNFPFVQLGTYQVEAFAREAAQRLAAAGLPAQVVPGEGQPSWRLLLGPAGTEAEQQTLLGRAVAEGFADAYLVRR